MISDALNAIQERVNTVERRVAEVGDAAEFGSVARSLDDRTEGTSVSRGEIERLISASGSKWGVDPDLVRAIVANESGFDADATSTAGARGLMQLMPDTAAAVGVSDPYDAAQNIAGGTRYLRGLLDRFGGDVRLAVAAYNAGPAAVARYGGVPPYVETRAYVTNVLANYARHSRTQP